MKANSETAEENMVITCSISSFWNEFLQQEHIDNESKAKQTKNQYYCPDFIDQLKYFIFLRFCYGQRSCKTKLKRTNQVKRLQTYQYKQSLQKPIPMPKQRNVSK